MIWIVRLGVFLLIAYLAVIAALWAFQSRLAYPAPQEVHPPARGFEAIELQTADGLALTAHWRAPQDGRPAIVWFHGNGGSLAGATVETETFASAGYGVLLVEYRGYGGNPGSPSEQGFYQDGRAAMDWLADQGFTADRTIIAAHSIGTGTATQMATEYGPAGLILVAPFTSARDVAAESFPWVPVRLLMRDHYDNLSKLREIDLPVLILHGDQDTLVPISHGEKLADAAPHAIVIHQFEGFGHDLSSYPIAQLAQLGWVEQLALEPAPDASGDASNRQVQPAEQQP